MRVRLYSKMTTGWVAFDDVSLAGWQPTSYYSFGAQRVAMRSIGVDGVDVLYWLAGDHLGTTSLVLNEAGDMVVARAGTFLRDGDAVRAVTSPAKLSEAN